MENDIGKIPRLPAGNDHGAGKAFAIFHIRFFICHLDERVRTASGERPMRSPHRARVWLFTIHELIFANRHKTLYNVLRQ